MRPYIRSDLVRFLNDNSMGNTHSRAETTSDRYITGYLPNSLVNLSSLEVARLSNNSLRWSCFSELFNSKKSLLVSLKDRNHEGRDGSYRNMPKRVVLPERRGRNPKSNIHNWYFQQITCKHMSCRLFSYRCHCQLLKDLAECPRCPRKKVLVWTGANPLVDQRHAPRPEYTESKQMTKDACSHNPTQSTCGTGQQPTRNRKTMADRRSVRVQVAVHQTQPFVGIWWSWTSRPTCYLVVTESPTGVNSSLMKEDSQERAVTVIQLVHGRVLRTAFLLKFMNVKLFFTCVQDGSKSCSFLQMASISSSTVLPAPTTGLEHRH